jgi:hypothetical protein
MTDPDVERWHERESRRERIVLTFAAVVGGAAFLVTAYLAVDWMCSPQGCIGGRRQAAQFATLVLVVGVTASIGGLIGAMIGAAVPMVFLFLTDYRKPASAEEPPQIPAAPAPAAARPARRSASDQAFLRQRLREFDALIGNDPRNALMYYLRGGIQAEIGEYADAKRDLEMALSLDPDAELRRGIEKLLAQTAIKARS